MCFKVKVYFTFLGLGVKTLLELELEVLYLPILEVRKIYTSWKVSF